MRGAPKIAAQMVLGITSLEYKHRDNHWGQDLEMSEVPLARC